MSNRQPTIFGKFFSMLGTAFQAVDNALEETEELLDKTLATSNNYALNMQLKSDEMLVNEYGDTLDARIDEMNARRERLKAQRRESRKARY